MRYAVVEGKEGFVIGCMDSPGTAKNRRTCNVKSTDITFEPKITSASDIDDFLREQITKTLGDAMPILVTFSNGARELRASLMLEVNSEHAAFDRE